MASPAATILFTTKNRRDSLRCALRSAVAQTGASIDILVIDDGSTDGTAAMVRAEFPQVRLEKHEQSRGCIVRRNEGAQVAAAPIVFSLDDDAEFSDPSTVAQILGEFSRAVVGAVSIPFVNVNQGPKIQQKAPDGDGAAYVIDAYIGTAHALRRDIFLALGGYRETLVHQGEERDYCLRLLNAGYVVQAGRASPILHHESPLRSFARMDFYGRRNDVLFVWYNVPWLDLPVHLVGTLFNGVRASISHAHHPWRMIAGLLSGLVGCLRCFGDRQPVARPIYRLNRRLKKGGKLLLGKIESDLPIIDITLLSAHRNGD